MQNKGFLYGILTAIMFGVGSVLIKLIFNSYTNLNSDMMFFIGSVFGVIILFICLVIKNKNLSFLKIDKKYFVYSFIMGGILQLFLANICVLKSIEFATVGIQKIITYCNPVLIILSYWLLFRRKISKKDILSVAVMLFGIFLVVDKIDLFQNKNMLKGIIYAVFSAIILCIYSIYISEISYKDNDKEDSIKYWFFGFMGACISSFTLLVLSNDLNTMLSILNFKLLFLLLINSLINFIIPYISYLKAIELLGAFKANIVITLSPVISIGLSVFILNENFELTQIFGACLIVMASLINNK